MPIPIEIADIADRNQPVALDIAALVRHPVIGEVPRALKPDVDFADLAGRQLPAVVIIDTYRPVGQRPTATTRPPQRLPGVLKRPKPLLRSAHTSAPHH